MSRKKATVVVIAAAAFAAAAGSAGYVLWPAVIDQGGGAATSPSYALRGSVGGPVVGAASSANYRCEVNSVGALEPGGEEPAKTESSGGCAPASGGPRGWLVYVLLCAIFACVARRRSEEHVAG